jgi:hypothetical protein
MSDTVRMRTLTWKSSYGFGDSYTKDLTMLQLRDLGKISQMVKAYYFLSKINYIDEILDYLCITPDLRIDKPFSFRGKESHKGTSLVKKVLDKYYANYTEMERIKNSSMQKSQSNRVAKGNIRVTNYCMSKSHNKKFNQGK